MDATRAFPESEERLITGRRELDELYRQLDHPHRSHGVMCMLARVTHLRSTA